MHIFIEYSHRISICNTHDQQIYFERENNIKKLLCRQKGRLKKWNISNIFHLKFPNTPSYDQLFFPVQP